MALCHQIKNEQSDEQRKKIGLNYSTKK